MMQDKQLKIKVFLMNDRHFEINSWSQRDSIFLTVRFSLLTPLPFPVLTENLTKVFIAGGLHMLRSVVSLGLPQAPASLWSLRAQKYTAESSSCKSVMVRLMELVAFWKFKKY